MTEKKRIVVGMSGGVDSSVTAALLQAEGHEVISLFMRNWDSLLNNDLQGNNNQDICPQEQDYLDALSVCQKLNIKLERIDFVKEYWDNVFTYFLEEFKKSRTPNPDILCNKYIKFDAFLKYAQKNLKADYIAMGHYARINYNPITKQYQLLKGIDDNKDQSYFLCQLTQKQLKYSLFPLGNKTKTKVRELAKKYNLPTATKKDSTGICFIGNRNFQTFLTNYLPANPGKIVDINTKTTIGNHNGVYYYTLGQRKGINLSGMKVPYFVVEKDVTNNILYVANDNENKWLMNSGCTVKSLNWINNSTLKNSLKCNAKFRYRQSDIAVIINFINNDEIKVEFSEKIRAITPGQTAVFYDGDICLGGGVIDQIFR
ncbi:tRNA 2-thiouridine(34) synthase MnmA [Spiroplasma endosymbiont of Aleiodes alternator]|uniref:tRNA 2-thiouridine(34) synthase MnmA n=1 Tax=Spiroplasma endosymbiont of Aleiodes alternator TaxID=3139329 RepID=UPI003CCB047F